MSSLPRISLRVATVKYQNTQRFPKKKGGKEAGRNQTPWGDQRHGYRRSDKCQAPDVNGPRAPSCAIIDRARHARHPQPWAPLRPSLGHARHPQRWARLRPSMGTPTSIAGPCPEFLSGVQQACPSGGGRIEMEALVEGGCYGWLLWVVAMMGGAMGGCYDGWMPWVDALVEGGVAQQCPRPHANRRRAE